MPVNTSLKSCNEIESRQTRAEQLYNRENSGAIVLFLTICLLRVYRMFSLVATLLMLVYMYFACASNQKNKSFASFDKYL